MTHPSVDGDKLNNKKQNKSLTPGGPAQLARSMPQEEHTLLEREACKVQGMTLDFYKHQKSKSGQKSQILCLIW